MAVLQHLSVHLCISLLIVIPGVWSAYDTNHIKEAQDFYLKLEDHLVKDNATLFLLKRFVFQVPSYDIFHFRVCISLENNSVTNCSLHNTLWQSADSRPNASEAAKENRHCWDFQWSNSAILGLLTIDLLTAFDNVIVPGIYYSIFDGQSLTVSFHLQSPPCLSETYVEDVLVEFLSWIKAYARSSGKPSSWDKGDKGYISKEYYYTWITEGYNEALEHGVRVALLCAFTALNILIPMTTAKYFSWSGQHFRPRITTNSQFIVSVYWGATLTFGLLNFVYLSSSLNSYFINNFPSVTACVFPVGSICPIPSGTSLYKHEVAALLIRMVLLPITLVVELLIAACTPKPHFPLPGCLAVSVLRRHFPCVYKEFILKIIHTILLWNIFVFIQILGLLTIPFCILLLVSPPLVIAYITTTFLAIVSIASTLVALLYFCGQLSCRNNVKRCSQALCGIAATITIIGLVLALAWLYYSFTDYGGPHTNGITGILLSLFPSIVITLVGWLIKKKLHNDATRDATNVNNNQYWEELTEVGHNHPNTDSEGSGDEDILPL